MPGTQLPNDLQPAAPAVVVEMDERAGPLYPGKRWYGYSRFVGDVAKIVAALVEIKNVVLISEIRDVKRRQPVVAVVADRNPHRALLGAVCAHSGARLETDVGELAVAIVAIKILGSRVIGDVDVRAST